MWKGLLIGLLVLAMLAAGLVHLCPKSVVDSVEDPGYGDKNGGFQRSQIINQVRHIAHKTDGAANVNKIIQLCGLAKAMGPRENRDAAAVGVQLGHTPTAGEKIGGEVAMG